MYEVIKDVNPGSYKPEEVAKMEDWQLFIEYETLFCDIWYKNFANERDYRMGNISDDKFNAASDEIINMATSTEYLMYVICKRNGIAALKDDDGVHIIIDMDEFLKWCFFYDNHFRNKLSDDEWKDMCKRRERGEDISQYLPQGDWREVTS